MMVLTLINQFVINWKTNSSPDEECMRVYKIVYFVMLFPKIM